MNPENENQFKDKEIERIAANLSKAGKHEFGASFKSAADRVNNPLPPQPVLSEKAKLISILQNPPEKPLDTAALNPENAPLDKKELYSIVKPLRTYERDIAEAIRTKNESVTSVNLAAQKKREVTGEVRPVKAETVAGNGLTILISVVLIVAATSIFILVYYFYSNRPAPITPTESTIITTDQKTTIDISGKSATDTANAIYTELGKFSTQNSLVRIDLTESGQTITIEKFFSLFGDDAPPALARALGPRWVFGFDKLSTNEPFIFVGANSFDNAFDSMLNWEKAMAKNLGPIFVKQGTVIAETNPTTGTNFQDTVIRNKDVRVLKDNLGNAILLYSFLDQKNLVITTNEETFKEILDRFFASQIVR